MEEGVGDGQDLFAVFNINRKLTFSLVEEDSQNGFVGLVVCVTDFGGTLFGIALSDSLLVDPVRPRFACWVHGHVHFQVEPLFSNSVFGRRMEHELIRLILQVFLSRCIYLNNSLLYEVGFTFVDPISSSLERSSRSDD